MIDYEELRIRIWKTGERRYLVFANGPTGGGAAVFALEKSPLAYRRELEFLLGDQLAGEPDEPGQGELRRLGRELFQLLLPEPVRDRLGEVLTRAQNRNRNLRVRFEVDPELMDLPFEVLCSPALDPLGAAALAPALSPVRSLSGQPLGRFRMPNSEESHAVAPLLVVAPGYAGAGQQLQAAAEIRKLDQARTPYLRTRKQKWMHLLGGENPKLPRPTRQNVERLFQAQADQPCAALLIGHGVERDGEVLVTLEREDGELEPIPAQLLAGFLAQARGLRLVVLNLCLGTRALAGEPFSGLAQALIAQGIPAVVAMQAEVSDDAAVELSPALFGALWRNLTLDEAVSQGRRAMALAGGRRSEWCNPVLFLHQQCGDGRLFLIPELLRQGQKMRSHVRDEEEVLERLQANPRVEDFVRGLDIVRKRGRWDEVAQFARVLLEAGEVERAEYERLAQEAEIEHHRGTCQEICRQLAAGEPPEKVQGLLEPIAGLLEPGVLECLADQVHQAADLWQGYREAVAAEERGDWEEAVRGFLQIRGQRRAGYRETLSRLRRAVRELRLLRLYGRAEEALDGERWRRAVALCRRILKLRPEGYREAMEVRGYAEGRLAAGKGDWSAAAEAYRTLVESGYRDAPLREAYARGRIAEGRRSEAGWKEAVEAYGVRGLADLFPDVAWRLPYARARVAEGAGDWPGSIAEYEALERDHPDHRSDAAARRIHAVGRRAEQEGRWREAGEQYAGLEPSELDPTTRAELKLPARRAYVEARRWESAGEWRRPLTVYRGDAADLREAEPRAERLRALVDALPWAEELAATGWAADPAATGADANPYAALAPAEIRPDSSMEAIKDASFVLMEKGAMSPESRSAWDRLRTLPGRLLADVYLYRLSDGEGLRRALAELEPGPAEELVASLAERLPRDAPLLFLLGGERGEAIAGWRQRRLRNPADGEVVHALALTAFFRARELAADDPEGAEEAWQETVACWTLVLNDDRYWQGRRREWEARYGQRVSAGDLARLRGDVIQELLDRVATETHPRAEGDDGEETASSRRRALPFEVELEGARALKRVGGLGGGDGVDRLAAGVLYLRQVGLGRRLGQRVAELAAQSDDGEREELLTALDAVLGTDEAEQEGRISPEHLFRLRCLFSELGASLLLLDRHRHREAVRALPPIHRRKLGELAADCPASAGDGESLESHRRECEVCRSFLERNPAYLCLPHRSARLLQDAVEIGTRAHLAEARSALAAGERAQALDGWRRAIELSANAGTQVRTKRAIVRVVLGRAEALAHERGRRRGERLSEGIALIEKVQGLVGSADQGQLDLRSAKLLTARGVWYGYGCHEYADPDYEKAADDLRAALRLTPDSVHARDNLSRALVYHAVQLRDEGRPAKVLRLFAEAIEVLHHGLGRTPGVRPLIEALRRALAELEGIILFELSPEQLAERIVAIDASRLAAGAEDEPSPSPADADARPSSREDGIGELMARIAEVRREGGDDQLRRSLLRAVSRLAEARAETEAKR